MNEISCQGDQAEPEETNFSKSVGDKEQNDNTCETQENDLASQKIDKLKDHKRSAHEGEEDFKCITKTKKILNAPFATRGFLQRPY